MSVKHASYKASGAVKGGGGGALRQFGKPYWRAKKQKNQIYTLGHWKK